MRHIVVEGMDGTGKTTLIAELVKRFGLPVHPKASTSVGGPVDYLDHWVDGEFMRPKDPGIYDRHPLISEPIYGPVIRGGLPGLFSDNEWLSTRIKMLAETTVVVWCSPPWSTVYLNITKARHNQMPGVAEHAYQLYHTYEWRRKAWRGPSIEYDYTRTEHMRNFVINRTHEKASTM